MVYIPSPINTLEIVTQFYSAWNWWCENPTSHNSFNVINNIKSEKETIVCGVPSVLYIKSTHELIFLCSPEQQFHKQFGIKILILNNEQMNGIK